ncbi:HAD family hydrolase [Streptomyces parvulus]|uniref:HAD family hydrolase n=1 Tax=Streptomyces parvulus TaxID=146923 RepID=A0A191V7B8_9ACTN|nr:MULTISPECIES: HAD family hydrolase [Streptomyces]ANJ10802.1 HAD family hydrolase [Streptomyces parvulus]MCC9155555.1 HAD family hydrolase [Streptomyces parvulus]MCE7687809.1 HAD family hydrolase [Streptomyces parvulus]MCQ4192766.1 HAD family hydrolase [Streptomyces parvulus]MZD59263.1 HAD-IA family hydrolase [Streptomyces sp. SID5606]
MDRAAVFDVDGTLVDTNHLHVVCWWEAFRQAGHEVPMHAVLRAVGLPSSDLVGHLLGEDRDRDRDAELSAAHKALYGQYFDRLPALPDAGRLLRRLAGDGWKVVLATSAGGPELGALRRAIDADDAIAATASADDVEEGKPSPEPVEHALELAGVPAERAVFVGDTVWDMRAGSRAGVRCVAVLCGGLPRADLEEAGADAVYADPAELLASLERSPLA